VKYLTAVNGDKHTLILSLKNRSVSAVPQSSAAGILTISKRIFNPHGSSAVCTSDLMCSTTTNIVSEAEYRKCKVCNSHAAAAAEILLRCYLQYKTKIAI